MPEVYTARAIHERFLAAPKLRLIPDGSVVRQTILKSVEKGRVVVRLTDGRAYDDKGCIEGPEGRRRRVPGGLTTLTLDDSVYLTLADSTYGLAWLKEDAGPGKTTPPPPPPPPVGRTTANSWDKVLEYAVQRPLVSLELTATKPADAAGLLSLAQPLGADEIAISVNTSGSLKDGGNINFAASDVRPTHPTKPLTVAQTVYNSLVEGSGYEAVLRLGFGPSGRSGLQSQLEALSESAPEGIRPLAIFEKPSGGGR
jgi:hypothetical protein